MYGDALCITICMRLKISNISIIVFTFLLFLNLTSWGQKSNTDSLRNPSKLYGLSLIELMNLKVSPASLTELKGINTPASITTITAKDIENTPARNAYDLIETYVPGAFWMNHHGGSRLGVRGINADREYKYLLLVNGVNMNQKAKHGVTSELENWDLGDVERIEVISGPGAVTYGPGAVMGVINIITKNSKNSEKGIQSSLSTNYLSKYNSMGTSFSIRSKNDKVSSYTYGSIQSTSGFAPQAYTVEKTSGEYGYVGKDFTSGPSLQEPTDYFADYNNIPQVKFHSQWNTNNGWGFFGRYTHSGASVMGVMGKGTTQTGYAPDSTILYGEPFNQYQKWNQHVTLSVNKEYEISKALTISGSFVYDNENYARRQSQKISYALSDDPSFVFNQALYNSATDFDHARYKKSNFSEEEITLKSIAVYAPSSKFSAALGAEVLRNAWRSPWGKEAEDFKVGELGAIISDTNSNSYGEEKYMINDEDAHFVGDGWSTFTFSTYSEVKYAPKKGLIFLASGRLDKDQYSKLLFSPRLALISQPNDQNSFRLVYQVSNRMNTAEQLYVQNYSNVKTNPERLESFEFIYTGSPSDKLLIKASSYLSNLNVLGWVNNNTGNKEGSTEVTGELSLAGLELGMQLSLEKLDLGLNHSYVKQLKWKLEEGVQSAGMSYSDYDRVIKYVDDDGNNQTYYVDGHGNDLNNWSNHSTKIFVNYKPIQKLKVHVNSQVFYGFTGAQNGLDMYSEVLDTLTNAENYKSELTSMLEGLEKEGVYKFQMRLNLSINYQFTDRINLMLYGLNLLKVNNKRYSYDTGNRFTFPNRVAFVNEPSAFGAKFNWKF